jgi:hypothetical protein
MKTKSLDLSEHELDLVYVVLRSRRAFLGQSSSYNRDYDDLGDIMKRIEELKK